MFTTRQRICPSYLARAGEPQGGGVARTRTDPWTGGRTLFPRRPGCWSGWKLDAVRRARATDCRPGRSDLPRGDLGNQPRVMSRRGLHLPDHRRRGGVREGEGHHLRARWHVWPCSHHESLGRRTGIPITNAPGENPVIEGWSSIADYQAILGLWQVSNIAIQGLTVQNTGVSDAEHGGYGIRVSSPQLGEAVLQHRPRHRPARHHHRWEPDGGGGQRGLQHGDAQPVVAVELLGRRRVQRSEPEPVGLQGDRQVDRRQLGRVPTSLRWMEPRSRETGSTTV